MSREEKNLTDHDPFLDLTIQSPASAFRRFIELVRTSPRIINIDPKILFDTLSPFLANPKRDKPYVHEIIEAYSAARISETFLKYGFFRLMKWFMPKGTIEQFAPEFISRLRKLEERFKTELKPGSIYLNLKPIRYIESPSGYNQVIHKYQIQIETLVESTPDDSLHTVTVEVIIKSKSTELSIDNLFPKPGFSTVGIKRTNELQVGQQQTTTEKGTSGAEISGGGAKLSAGIESSSSEQTSASISVGSEKNTARVEQYLISRQFGNRAIWQILSGVGPIDVAGTEYKVEILAPSNCKSLDISVDARVEWLNAGVVPAHLQETLDIPIPSTESKIVSS